MARFRGQSSPKRGVRDPQYQARPPDALFGIPGSVELIKRDACRQYLAFNLDQGRHARRDSLAEAATQFFKGDSDSIWVEWRRVSHAHHSTKYPVNRAVIGVDYVRGLRAGRSAISALPARYSHCPVIVLHLAGCKLRVGHAAAVARCRCHLWFVMYTISVVVATGFCEAAHPRHKQIVHFPVCETDVTVPAPPSKDSSTE